MLMSVEKRKRPIWIGNTGVFVPWTMACTAIGINGVLVAGLVSVAAGEGVMTKKVGVSWSGTGLLVAGAEAGGAVINEVGTLVRGTAVWLGTACGTLGRFMKNRTAATATDRNPPINDQRARTTYLCLER